MHKEQYHVLKEKGDQIYRITKYWESVSKCPICFSRKNKFFLSRFKHDIYECLNCSHNYMNPRIKFAKATEIYTVDYSATNILSSKNQQKLDEIKSNFCFDLVKQLGLKNNDSVLDVGCGAGRFLKTAYKNGWSNCVGVDMNPNYKNLHKQNSKIQFKYTNFEKINFNNLNTKFDLITMWNVLEHIYDPNFMINKLTKLLNKKGKLFIMVPNVKSLATSLIREKSATFNWKHVSHFTPKSLVVLMRKNKLKLDFIGTAVSEIENIKSYMNGKWPYSGYNDPKGNFKFISTEYIHKRMLGSRIYAVFSKR